jgi:glutamate/tyrosine decarboxylase-like PLP-dependent enzyme
MSDLEALLTIARDAAVRHLGGLDARAVLSTEGAVRDLAQLREPFPAGPSDAAAVIELLDRVGSPATTASNGGRFFGFVVGGTLPVALAADWLTSTWDQNAGLWILSPIGAELEVVAASWLLEIFDLPRDAAVGFVTGSTMGEFSAFAAARSALLTRVGYDVRRRGLRNAPPLRVVASEEVHPTNIAALAYLGIGADEIERCPVDGEGRIIASRMPALDDHTLLIVQAGNINSGACDPFEEICAKARSAGAWVHVDGAFGLWARASRRTAPMVAGIELADSWSVDAHKWLNVPYDSAFYICRDAQAVEDVFGVQAAYLLRDERRQNNNFTPELSRRARGVDVWAALKHLGRSGLETLIDGSCAHASRFAEGLRAAGYDVMNEVVLNQVVFACADEGQTRRALDYIQRSGVCWLGPTQWKGRFAMRISVSSWATTPNDVEHSLAVMADAFRAR